MFCYCLYMLLDWPGIHTCFITCYIVALTTAAEAVEKLTLRFLGCVLGAAAGIAAIVFVMPSLTSIGGLMGVVFAGAFASAWIAAGSPRIAYAGFQIAFAFFLCVLQGPTPDFDMTIARDRVIGILFGDLVSYRLHARLAGQRHPAHRSGDRSAAAAPERDDNDGSACRPGAWSRRKCWRRVPPSRGSAISLPMSRAGSGRRRIGGASA